jgi:S1-C subfamily serine protease
MKGRLIAALVAVGLAATACELRIGGSATGSGSSPAVGTESSATGSVSSGLVIVNSTLGQQQEEAAGTGIVLTSSGEVLTNNHVIAGATSVQVVDVGNGQTYPAAVVGFDRTRDVAVLKLQGAQGLATAPLETSHAPAVGDQVSAIGNAGGTGSLTTAPGTVSATDQSITATDASSGSSEQLTGLIQVNADVQAGDSGGALVDSSGRVIGMTTAATTGFQFQRSQSAQAGFAIPITAAVPIGRQIEAGSSSGTVHVGATAELGVEVSSSQPVSGAQIESVVAGSPAQDAGLVPGDVITSLGGAAVDSATTLTNLMDRHHPGQSTTVGWVDQFGQSSSATVTLAAGPAG